MALFQPQLHPHGMDETPFVELFTADRPVIFAYHGYQRAIHEIVHGRVNAERFHVRGHYRYTVINGQPVLVEPGTRRVVEVIR